jgi:hypothetical protein
MCLHIPRESRVRHTQRGARIVLFPYRAATAWALDGIARCDLQAVVRGRLRTIGYLMNSKWLSKLNNARAWVFGIAVVIAGTVWFAQHL